MRPTSLAAWVAWMTLLLVALLLAEHFLIGVGVVAGPSMEPALLAGDRVLVDRWTFGQRLPRTGEVVVLRGPDGASLIKRVVAAPADRLGMAPRPDIWSIAPGAPIWVRGDRAERSLDSRSFGPVPSSRIVGRPVLRYWPPERFGRVR